MHIIIDTREQQPWSFPPEVARTTRSKLDAGDYALASDLSFVIERKSMDDLVGTISTGWERFQREIDRMELMECEPKIVIVEGSWVDILGHKYNHPQVSPRFVQSQLALLSFRSVHILFADNAHAAAFMAYGLFRQRLKNIQGAIFDAADTHCPREKSPAPSDLGLPQTGHQLDNPKD